MVCSAIRIRLGLRSNPVQSRQGLFQFSRPLHSLFQRSAPKARGIHLRRKMIILHSRMKSFQSTRIKDAPGCMVKVACRPPQRLYSGRRRYYQASSPRREYSLGDMTQMLMGGYPRHPRMISTSMRATFLETYRTYVPMPMITRFL